MLNNTNQNFNFQQNFSMNNSKEFVIDDNYNSFQQFPKTPTKSFSQSWATTNPQEITPKLGRGMSQLMFMDKDEEQKENDLLLATQKQTRSIRKDLSTIQESAKKLDFSAQNPYLKQSSQEKKAVSIKEYFQYEENSNSLDKLDFGVTKVKFGNNENYKEKYASVLYQFMVCFNNRDQQLLNIFDQNVKFEILNQPLHSFQETIQALSSKFSNFVIPYNWEEQVEFSQVNGQMALSFSNLLNSTKGQQVKYVITFKIPNNQNSEIMQKVKEIRMKLFI